MVLRSMSPEDEDLFVDDMARLVTLEVLVSDSKTTQDAVRMS